MPLEIEHYPCVHCNEPVRTEWCAGLLPGPYALVGDCIVHEHCWNDYFKDWPTE